MTYFYNFWQVFKENVYNHKKLYRKAVNDAIKEAAKRLGKELPENESNGALLAWVKNNLYSPNSVTTTAGDKASEITVNAKSSFNQELLSYSVKDKEISCQLNMSLKKVQEKCLDLEKVCLVCGKSDISCLHPLFVGGLCNNCQVGYWESLHVMDDDGYYMYCCVCGGGTKLLLCDNQNCCRCFCTFCLDVLIKENVSCQHLSISPWLCFLCIEKSRHGFLIRRDGWFESLNSFVYKDFSTKDAEIMELPAVVPLNERRPIRVLSLFDGICTGLLALKKLNIMVECYYASEIDLEAICVAQVQHSHQVVHIGDIRKIYDKQLLEWGPFDLVIGGSPCNDLSIVNPARKGIWSSDGSGVLFFEFVRVLRSCQLIASCNNQFLYWIFENVVSMDRASKATITHFLQVIKTHQRLKGRYTLTYEQVIADHNFHQASRSLPRLEGLIEEEPLSATTLPSHS
ncbi:DNA (cytosine-5)-methyltransferase 3A-like isoform X3 [Clavelina lepadiformis]|uniref:DNA (cytosine-5)-methyltransferase 3A-like isoform X3 n=1 Tax=Clavelina lepadiformis TaxID=159417 RepID=UPI0040412AAF